MSNQPKHGTYINKKISKKPNTLIRAVSAIFIMVFLLVSCVGCTSHISTEEFQSLKNQLTGEISALKNNNAALQQELDSMKNANQAAQGEIDSLKSANQEAQGEIDSLKSANQAAQVEIDSLKNSNQESQAEIGSLKSDCEAAQQEIEKLKEQLQSLKDSIPNDSAKKIRIYIDQGHNPTSYHNSGAVGNGLYEQDLTFAIGCLLAELLEKDGRFEVCLSRPTASTVLGTDDRSSLEARVKGAQEFQADYFISLHVNSFESETANGIEVFAANQSSISFVFGSSILQGLIASTNLRDRGMKLNPELYVLKNTTMPAVLVEMGFISNSEDAALLSESPEVFAQGIYNGILAYFELPPQNSSTN